MLEMRPDCGGELLDRPARTGKNLAEQPASTERKYSPPARGRG